METNEAVELLSVLGERTRVEIVDRLANGPKGVRELADDLPVSRPAVSQHLKVLKDAGLVRDRAEGTKRIYSLEPTGFEVLRTYLDRVWAAGLASFKEAAEAAGKDSEQ